MARKFRDIIGQRFGKLVVISRVEDNQKYGYATFECQCDCGNKHQVWGVNLVSRNFTKSCGCWRRERAPIMVNQFIRKSFGEAAFNRLYNGFSTRKYEFKISREDFRDLIQRPCHYCGDSPHNVVKGRYGNCVYSGLDRVDNQKPYTIDNVVPCCKQCNFAKGKLTVNEFLNWLGRIAKHQMVIKEMKVDKTSNQYDSYKLELSYGQILAVRDALKCGHAVAQSDEMLKELDWYLTRLPRPGEEKDAGKDDALLGGAPAPGGPAPDGDIVDLDLDSELPMPGEEGGDLPPEGGELEVEAEPEADLAAVEAE